MGVKLTLILTQTLTLTLTLMWMEHVDGALERKINGPLFMYLVLDDTCDLNYTEFRLCKVSFSASSRGLLWIVPRNAPGTRP